MRHTYYFETTARLEENSLIAADLRKQLETSNNFAWKALGEIQSVLEALDGLGSGQAEAEKTKILEKMTTALNELSQQHQSLVAKSVSDLISVSATIADDLKSVEQMIQEQEYVEFHRDLKAVGRRVADEFKKPSTELNEAEELQELIKRYRSFCVAA